MKSKKRKRRRVFICAALLLGILAPLVFCEVALRLYIASRGWTPNCYATGLAFFIPDHQSGYTLRPGLQLRSSAYDVTVNSLGFRGPEISPTPDSQTIRVAVLGGSSVFGYLVPQGQDSCAQLESLLKAAGVESEVINAGVPGFNMTQVRHRYNDAIVPLRPDYVILYLGWNNTPFLISDTPTSLDTSPPAPPLLQRMLVKSALYGLLRYRLFPPNNPRFAPPSSASTKVTEAGAREFQRELDRLIDAITTSGAAPIISTQISASAVDCKHLNQFLGSTPQQIEANRKIGNWISTTMRNTASDRDIELVDCAKLANCEQELLGDTIHLTKLGHEVVAKAWATAILGKIEAVDR